MKEVGIQVTRARAEKGWTLQELASKAEIQCSKVVDIENGSEKVTIKELVKVAVALGMNTHITFRHGENPEGESGGMTKCPDCRRFNCDCGGGEALTAPYPQGVTGTIGNCGGCDPKGARGVDDSGLTGEQDDDDYDPRS